MKFYEFNSKTVKAFSCLLVAGCLLIPSLSQAQMQEEFDTATDAQVTLYKGDLISLKVYSLTRLAITDPGIVEIVNAEVDKLTLVGQAEGETSMFIWDAKGKRKVELKVVVKDLDYVMARMRKLFASAKVEGIKLEKNQYEGKLVASGKIQKEKKAAYSAIVDKFSDQVIDMVTEDAKLIEIDVQISELNTTLTRVLGFDWTNTAGGMSLQYAETLPSGMKGIGDWLKIGDISRTTAILSTVNMLVSEGKARVLSKPNVVVTNGEDATFLVGGEIPIVTSTVSEGNVSTNVSFKSYGIDLTVTPTIKEDKIDVTLSVAIRDIDDSHAVGGNVAFTTRTADTKLLLQDGQTIVLAGLIKENKSDTVKRVPFLSKIPVVGLLFRSRNTPNQQVEVVISLTPRILKGRESKSLIAGEEAKKDEALAEAANTVEKETTTEEFRLKSVTESGNGTKAFSDETQIGVGAKILGSPSAEDSAGGETGAQSEAEVNAEAEVGERADPAGYEEAATEIKADETGPGVENVSQALTAYVQSVQKKISEAISFPYEAKEKGWDGTVTLQMVLLSDGKLNKVSVKETSGHEIFDNDALNTAQIVAPFAPFPAEIDLTELEVTVPITYSPKVVLEGEQKDTK